MSTAQSFADAGHPVTGSTFASVSDGEPAAAITPPPRTAASELAARHSPWVAGILSGFPGLGSIYNGSYARGVAFFLAVVGTMNLASRGQDLWGFGVAFLWLFNMIDAFREARLIRAGVAYDLGASRMRPATSAAEGLGLGAVLFLIGLVSFLDLSLGIDVDWIFELWPFGLMIAGAWFIVSAIRRSRAANAARAAYSGSAPPPPSMGSSDSVPRSDVGSPTDIGPPPHPPQGW